MRMIGSTRDCSILDEFDEVLTLRYGGNGPPLALNNREYLQYEMWSYEIVDHEEI